MRPISDGALWTRDVIKTRAPNIRPTVRDEESNKTRAPDTTALILYILKIYWLVQTLFFPLGPLKTQHIRPGVRGEECNNLGCNMRYGMYFMMDIKWKWKKKKGGGGLRGPDMNIMFPHTYITDS